MDSTRGTSAGYKAGRFNVTKVDHDDVKPEKEGLKAMAFRLLSEFKEWVKDLCYRGRRKLYSSAFGAHLSIFALKSVMGAFKKHSTAVELFETMRTNIQFAQNDSKGKLAVPFATAFSIIDSQIEKANRKKEKVKEYVKSSEEDAKFVNKNNEKHRVAFMKFKASLHRLDTSKISRTELEKLFKEVDRTITKECTPGLFTRETTKSEMNEVRKILLDALTESNKDLKLYKKRKNETFPQQQSEEEYTSL